MRFLQRLAATGLAGCMAVMGTVSELSFAAKEITIEYGAVSTTAMKAEPATEAAQATESAFPYSIAVPVSKYVYPGDEVDLRFVIQNALRITLSTLKNTEIPHFFKC